MNSMNVTLQSTPSTATSMKGTSFAATGLFDYELFDRIWFRGSAGYQGFAAQSSDSCPGGSCNVNIGYLDLGFLARYLFANTDFRPWAGLGFDMLFPLTKSSTALDSSSMNNSGVIVIAAGFDWSLNPNMYVPVSLEYGMFPKSSTVDANWIVLRAGVAVPF
jgi:outer membrane protein W